MCNKITISTPLEDERRRRINITLWAYAYEYKANPIVDDAKFDETCKAIDLSISTGNDKLDQWFKDNFLPHTGQWIHKHPELNKIKALYNRVIKLQ